MNYHHTAHRTTRMSEGQASAVNILRRVPLESFTRDPYLLQPMAFAQVNTALANPDRMAVTEAMAPAPTFTALQQPCKGIVCNLDAACNDLDCPGHPFNTASEDPTDFAGLPPHHEGDDNPCQYVDHRARAIFWRWYAAGVLAVITAAAIYWLN